MHFVLAHFCQSNFEYQRSFLHENSECKQKKTNKKAKSRKEKPSTQFYSHTMPHMTAISAATALPPSGSLSCTPPAPDLLLVPCVKPVVPELLPELLLPLLASSP